MFSYDPNSEVNLPWFETNEISKLDQVPAKFKEAAESLHYKGYCILDTEVEESLIDAVNEGIFEHLKKDNPKLNPDFYHYNSSPRIIEAWKHIDSIVSLSNNKNILDFLEIMYERTPLPFSTINFLRGSEQPMHSDYMHFSSKPERYLCGAWFALEDVHQDSGPLAVVAGSRDLPIVTIDELGLQVPKNTKQLKANYTIYEEAVRSIIEENNLTKEPIFIKKGQCLIWAANTLHGGSIMNEPSLTRKSLVVHYHFSGCEYYNPGFSSFKNNKLAKRTLEIIT
jgi:ectoine hydroxylase-related dioxygenase (phytanoyl-CoA dioxygenase family)